MREIERLLYGTRQEGEMMIMIMKTPGSQVDFPVAEGNRKEGGGEERGDLHKDTQGQAMSAMKGHGTEHCAT